MKTAIDLYSGIGGWTLGAKLAGTKIVASYEWWSEANNTHNQNFSTHNENIDIRKMSFDDVPKPGTIDFVLGSPPCTQFSFANRGGNGDIADGLKDIAKYLEVVRHLKPKYWAMENVPRVATVLKKELAEGGQLEEFSDLFSEIMIVDMSEYGLPQARKRMIAGHFPGDLLREYSKNTPKRNLGDVLKALNNDPVIDPIYGITIPKSDLTDNAHEDVLDSEEARMNREAKTFHPVYNRMSFPDSLNRPSRTVTALCTRVSRESIVVESDETDKFRRLTARERGVLQAFPITYQFYGNSYPSKLKMIGNAFPPLMSYYVVSAMNEIAPNNIETPDQAAYRHSLPDSLPKPVTLNSSKKSYSQNRAFKAAIKGLRFGSGVRFELSNNSVPKTVKWMVRFFYGSSKQIKELMLTEDLYSSALNILGKKDAVQVELILENELGNFKTMDGGNLQSIWRHLKSGVTPFDVADQIGKAASQIQELFSQSQQAKVIEQYVSSTFTNKNNEKANSIKKLENNSLAIYSGIITGSWINANCKNL